MKIILPFFMRRFLSTVTLAVASSAAFAANNVTPASTQPMWLSQGWSESESEWFYSTSQGSHLLPYAFYVSVEQPGSTKLFNSPENIEKYKCIARAPSPGNPDGLPIGFVGDPGTELKEGLLRDNRSLGFTCAACHTGQITYKGTAIRIDGGPTMADFDGFTIALRDALSATQNDSAKFKRFASRVLGPDLNVPGKKGDLLKALKSTVGHLSQYIDMNRTAVPYGYARLDAFGRIFNTTLATIHSKSRLKPDAPVSFPFLWDVAKANSVQWTGSAPNGPLGSLARNVGEVVGVFGVINTTDRRPPYGYASSVRFDELRRMEKLLKSLSSPAWPEKTLGKIDSKLASAGKTVFAENCSECHKKLSSWSWLPWVYSFKSQLIPLNVLGTDRTAAAIIKESYGDTGILNGARKLFTLNQKYGPSAPVEVLTGDTVLRVLIGSVTEPPAERGSSAPTVRLKGNGLNETGDRESLAPAEIAREKEPKADLKYRARPLDGIWATGPFLHNGSVPTLADLLKPEGKRPTKFSVGNREFDPVKVGPVTTGGPGTSVFDTSLKGNSNKGHTFGTCLSDEKKAQLLEYLKTL